MFQVPETFLNQLKCHFCDGYLNAKPVVVKDGKQICAKCYGILPQTEKNGCVREISYEAIASCLVFPCRYHQMGCDYKFAWNTGSRHELECSQRYFTVPDLVVTNRRNSAGSETQKSSSIVEIENSVNNTLERTYVFPPLNEENNNHALYENIYSTINTKPALHCLSCHVEVDKSTRSVCLFGHISCLNCKRDMCVACVKNLDGTSTIACKNASKGCEKLLHQEDVGHHRDNCEFNEIACPFDRCKLKRIHPALIEHLKLNHGNEIVLSTALSRTLAQSDETIVILCYEGIFRCVYYYYATSVEIFVVYLGPCVKSLDYYFEVAVEVNKRSIKKKLGCANWNNNMLAKGVEFDKKEFNISADQPLRFEMNLKLHRVSFS
uniref:SIAH-type domain-containing protein n=1 Tax=Dendroctonus ponderosae TaxID=77166 RepID=A0AAR5NYS1_DENPD